MEQLLTIDAARAAEIVALAVPALTAELPALDRASLELVLAAEKAKGESDERTTAIAAITAAIAALDAPEPDETPAPEPDTAEAEEPVIEHGLASMHNDDLGGCSWRGQSYEPDDDGVVHVPVDAASDLVSHGFRFVTRAVAKA